MIGLNLCCDFIEDEKASGIDSVCRQIDYFKKLECDDIIAFGFDFDGCTVNEDFKGIEKIPLLYRELKKAGYEESFLDKMFYENANKFFK